MIFISLGKWRKKPTKETVAQVSKIFEQWVKQDIKILGQYWLFGRYDVVTIVEAKDEKTMMKASIRMGDLFSTETLLAVPREEAIKLVE
jgi:uncharacterized protein with GYD domain